jgi:hypothetical protein
VLPDICKQHEKKTTLKNKENATHFEFDLDDEIAGGERQTTPEPSL